MTNSPATTTPGHCRCGRVRFQVTGRPLITFACHCTGCQRMTASAFSLSVLTRSAGFEVTQGEPVLGGLHGATRHFFCPHCMTWMFTRPAGMDFFVNVRPTMLEDTSWTSPFIETYTSEKLAFAATGAAHSYEKFPAMEDFEPLMAAYAASLA